MSQKGWELGWSSTSFSNDTHPYNMLKWLWNENGSDRESGLCSTSVCNFLWEASNLLYRFVGLLEQIGVGFRMESGILIWLSIHQLLFTYKTLYGSLCIFRHGSFLGFFECAFLYDFFHSTCIFVYISFLENSIIIWKVWIFLPLYSQRQAKRSQNFLNTFIELVLADFLLFFSVLTYLSARMCRSIEASPHYVPWLCNLSLACSAPHCKDH